ncbi:MAG TPA: zinc-binding alcohol dehydrogenase, partial [Anaerolineae bacterium]|nr:zinc-binding alcohol dehydrogenase [Anaerolineae bacterium]
EEILIEAETTVVSAGTELANFTALSPGVWIPGSWNAYPWRPGYGLVGHVRAVGSDKLGFAEGQRIFCFGKHASLQRYEITQHTPYGAAFPLDDNLPATQAIMARMALIGITAPQVTEFEDGDTVAIFGLGLVGNFAAQLYQLGGAKVIGLDVISERCKMAQSSGIKNVLDVRLEEQVEAILDLTGGQGVEVAVDAVGHSAVIEACVKVCAPLGQVILLGSPRKAYETNVTAMLRPIHHRWIVIRGALEWRLPPYPVRGSKHSIASNLQLILDHIQCGRLLVEPLITHVIKPSHLLEAYHGLLDQKESYLGVVVDWRQDI